VERAAVTAVGAGLEAQKIAAPDLLSAVILSARLIPIRVALSQKKMMIVQHKMTLIVQIVAARVSLAVLKIQAFCL